MQEEVENRVVNLAITTTRLSWRALVSGYHAYKQQEAKLVIKDSSLPRTRE